MGLLGATVFLRPLWAAPATTVLDRTFWWDTIINLDDLIAVQRNFAQGLAGRDFLDWLFAAHFFYPQPRPLATSELMPLAALLTYPLHASPVLAHNVALTVAAVLNVVAGASFARAVGARRLSATVAGVGFAFWAYTNFASARLQLLFLFPMAFAFASVMRWAWHGRWRDAWLVGLWSLIQALLCLYYALFLAVTLPFVAVVARLSITRGGYVRDHLRLGFAATVCGLPALFLLWPYRQLRAELGLQRTMIALLQQSGDPQMFLWADHTSVWGNHLRDVYSWDTAYFSGSVILVSALAGVCLWIAARPRTRWPVLALALAGLAVSYLHAFEFAVALWVLAVASCARQARAHRATMVAPALATLALIGLVLFLGPQPKAWERPLGESPYAWLYAHAPFFDGLRVASRGAVLVHLVLCAVAGLLLSRIERFRWGRAFVAVALAWAFVEGMPVALAARKVPVTCEDQALATLHAMGVTATGEISPAKVSDSDLAQKRHQAELCDVSITLGSSGFTPPVAGVISDAVNVLPDPAAHAQLWDAGIRHTIVRSSVASQSVANLKRIEPLIMKRIDVGPDTILVLKPPELTSTELPMHLAGPRVRVVEAKCGQTPDALQPCPEFADGDDETHWTLSKRIAGGQTVTLSFARSLVTGIEWHAFTAGTDLPRGLRIEYEGAAEQWVMWREIRSISQLMLARYAAKASLALDLPPVVTGHIRITQTGMSNYYYLSGSELEVIGTPE